MTRDKIFYGACFGFGAGVLWRSFFRVDVHAALVMGLLSLFLILFFSLVWKKNWGILIFVFALAFSLGILRFSFADKPPPEFFRVHIGQKISVSGVIIDEPDVRGNNIKFTVEAHDGKERTRLLVFTTKDAHYQYGDGIRIVGKLERPENFLTDQEKEFDYVAYLRNNGVFYTMHYPQVDVISHGHGNSIKGALLHARERFAANLEAVIPMKESILMEALILGERSSFSEALRQAFVNTGTIHIVTISGYHVALVAEWIMKILGFLPLNVAIGGGILAIFFYVIITGGAATAIRAGIMATLVLLARATGRMYDARRALVVTAVLMVLINPFILAFDISFELSFLSVIAIIFLMPRIEKYFYWVAWKWLRDILAVTCTAYLFVLPFILYKMGSLSLVALPANIAILPLIPATMILGFITGFAGFVSVAFAWLPGALATLLLHYELAAIGILSRLPFSALAIPNFPFLLVVLIYAIFCINIFHTSNQDGDEKQAWKRRAPRVINMQFLVLVLPVLLTVMAAGFFALRHYQARQEAQRQLEILLAGAPLEESRDPYYVADARTKSDGCQIQGPLPDHDCTPGAVFEDATVEQICVSGYTKTVRNVSTNLRKEVYAEYGIAYPEPRGAYEVDHLIPLALGGSNDIANLFPEAAEPTPGFHEKDIVEIYLQQEVCRHHVALSVAQRQIAIDWLPVYRNLSQGQISAIKKKYGGERGVAPLP